MLIGLSQVGIQSVASSMAELCSSMPTSGGLYYASAVLAPPGWGPLAAWITGWSNWIGQVTGAPSVNYGTAAMILACGSIQNPGYVPTNYQTFLLTVFIMLIHSVMASFPTRWIARVNSAGSTFNIIAIFIVIILIPAACNRTARGLSRFNPSSEVWGNIYQGTDYPKGVSVLMSFIGVIWTMSGYVSSDARSWKCSCAKLEHNRNQIADSHISLGLPVPSCRRVLQRQHRLPTCNFPHLRSGRYCGLGSSARCRLHCRGHLQGAQQQSWPAICCVSRRVCATSSCTCDTFSYYHRWLRHGAGMHDCR